MNNMATANVTIINEIVLAKLLDDEQREKILKQAYHDAYENAFVEQQFKLCAILLRYVGLGAYETRMFVDSLYAFWKVAFYDETKTKKEEENLLKFVHSSFLSLFDETRGCQQYVTSLDCIKLSHIFVCSKLTVGALEFLELPLKKQHEVDIYVYFQAWSVHLLSSGDDGAANDILFDMSDILMASIQNDTPPTPSEIVTEKHMQLYNLRAYIMLHCALYLRYLSIHGTDELSSVVVRQPGVRHVRLDDRPTSETNEWELQHVESMNSFSIQGYGDESNEQMAPSDSNFMESSQKAYLTGAKKYSFSDFGSMGDMSLNNGGIWGNGTKNTAKSSRKGSQNWMRRVSSVQSITNSMHRVASQKSISSDITTNIIPIDNADLITGMGHQSSPESQVRWMFQSYAMRTPKPHVKKVRKSPVDVGIPAYTVLTLAPSSSSSSSSSRINHEQQRTSSSMNMDTVIHDLDPASPSAPKSHKSSHYDPSSRGHEDYNSRMLRNLAMDGSMHSLEESVGGGSYHGVFPEGFLEGAHEGFNEGFFDEGSVVGGSIGGRSIGHTVGSGSVAGLHLGSAEGSIHGMEMETGGVRFLGDDIDDGTAIRTHRDEGLDWDVVDAIWDEQVVARQSTHVFIGREIVYPEVVELVDELVTEVERLNPNWREDLLMRNHEREIQQLMNDMISVVERRAEIELTDPPLTEDWQILLKESYNWFHRENKVLVMTSCYEDRMTWFNSHKPWLQMAESLEFSPMVLVCEKSYWEGFIRKPTFTGEMISQLIGCLERRRMDVQVIYLVVGEALKASPWNSYCREKVIEIEESSTWTGPKKQSQLFAWQKIRVIHMQRFLRTALYRKYEYCIERERIFAVQGAIKQAFLEHCEVANQRFWSKLWRWGRIVFLAYRKIAYELRHRKIVAVTVIQKAFRRYVCVCKLIKRLVRVRKANRTFMPVWEVHFNFTRMMVLNAWRAKYLFQTRTRSIDIIREFLLVARYIKLYEERKEIYIKVSKIHMRYNQLIHLNKWKVRLNRYRRTVARFTLRVFLRMCVFLRRGVPRTMLVAERKRKKPKIASSQQYMTDENGQPLVDENGNLIEKFDADDENQVYYYTLEVATTLIRTKRWLQRWKIRQRENQRYRAKLTIATLLPYLIEKKRRRRFLMDRRIRVENQGYAVYKITKKYKQQVVSIWIHATVEEKFRRIGYKIMLQIRHARQELVERVTTHLRDSWHRRYKLYFIDRWKRFVGYIYKHASRIARFFQSLRSRKLGKKLRKHLRVLRRALQPVINRHFFRRFAEGCLLQYQERYVVALMRIVKRFLMLGSFYRWLRGTRHQRFVRVCMWRRRHVHSPRSVHDTELLMQTVASVNANNTALLDSSYSAPLLKAFHVWLNCAQALRLYKQQTIYAIAHDGIVNGGIRRAMSWHDRATNIQCMIRSYFARQRTKLQRKYCHVVRMVTLRILDFSMTRFKHFMMIARRATATLQRVFRQQSSKKLALVVMNSQKQKDLRLNRYASVCEHNLRFRLLQKMMCNMQFTYALRQLQIKRREPTNVGSGPGPGQGSHVSIRDGDDGIHSSDDGDYCVPSIRRPVDEWEHRSSSSSPLMFPRENQTIDFSFPANTLSRNVAMYDTFYNTPYDTSYDRHIPSRDHPTLDPSHMKRNNDSGDDLSPDGGRLRSGGGRSGSIGGRLSVLSLGSSHNSDDDSSNFPGNVNMTSSRNHSRGSLFPSHTSTGRVGQGSAQKQKLSKRSKAMLLSEHPVWEEMTGTSHGDGVHSIALALPDINMNIHASAAAAASYMRTISRHKKDRKSSSFSVSSWDHQGGDDTGSRGSSTRANSPDRTYDTALTPLEKKMFLRDEDVNVQSLAHSHVHSPNLLSKKKHGNRQKKLMVNKRMAYKEPDLTMYQPPLDTPTTKQQPQAPSQQPQQKDINEFKFDKFDQKSTQNPRSHRHAQPSTTNNTSTNLRHSQSAQGVRSRPLASMESTPSQPPPIQQAYQGDILMSRTFNLDDRDDAPYVGLRKAFTAFAPTYTGAHRQQQQQQQQYSQAASETIGNVDFESTEYHSQAFTLRKTGVFTLVTSQVVLTRVEIETCLRDADTVICHDLNHPRASRDIAKFFQGKKLILMGGYMSEREIGYLSEAWRARPRDATSVPFTLQLNHVQCANHRTQLRLIAGLLTWEMDDRSIMGDDIINNKDPHSDRDFGSNSHPTMDVRDQPLMENRLGVLSTNLTSQFNLRTLICGISSVGCLGMVCLLVGLKYNTTVEILSLNFEPFTSSQQGLVPSIHEQATKLIPGLPLLLVSLLQGPVSGIPPVIGDCFLFLQDNRTIQELSLRGHVLSIKMLKSLYVLISSGGLPSMKRLEYMVSRIDDIAMRLSQQIIHVAALRKQQQPQRHPTVGDERDDEEGEGGVDMQKRMNVILQPLEVDVVIVG